MPFHWTGGMKNRFILTFMFVIMLIAVIVNHMHIIRFTIGFFCVIIVFERKVISRKDSQN